MRKFFEVFKLLKIKTLDLTIKNLWFNPPKKSYYSSFKYFINYKFYKALTFFVSFDLRLEALFLWIMFFFTNLSIIEETNTNREPASFLSVVSLSFWIAVRADLCWYLFLTVLSLLDLILFIADLWFAILFYFSSP